MIGLSAPGAGNPADDHGPNHDTKARGDHPVAGGPSGTGSEGGSIGVITAMSVEQESLPPNTRSGQEPDGEWLK